MIDVQENFIVNFIGKTTVKLENGDLHEFYYYQNEETLKVNDEIEFASYKMKLFPNNSWMSADMLILKSSNVFYCDVVEKEVKLDKLNFLYVQYQSFYSPINFDLLEYTFYTKPNRICKPREHNHLFDDKIILVIK
ncbi:MAG: hypothetical protein IPN86_00870 [Saprospiraceae bacterium]|nr:hypothetical protein [Saprospiraceae bacterium]